MLEQRKRPALLVHHALRVPCNAQFLSTDRYASVYVLDVLSRLCCVACSFELVPWYMQAALLQHSEGSREETLDYPCKFSGTCCSELSGGIIQPVDVNNCISFSPPVAVCISLLGPFCCHSMVQSAWTRAEVYCLRPF